MNPPEILLSTWVVSIIGLSATVISVAIDSDNFREIIDPVYFLSYSPYVGIAFLTMVKRFTVIQSQVWLAGIILIVIVSIYTLISNQLHRFEQGHLLYWVLSLYQWAATVCVFVVILFL